jgi:hypothetical protein
MEYRRNTSTVNKLNFSNSRIPWPVLILSNSYRIRNNLVRNKNITLLTMQKIIQAFFMSKTQMARNLRKEEFELREANNNHCKMILKSGFKLFPPPC